MSKLSDRDRILLLLSETDGLPNLRIKTELNLADDRLPWDSSLHKLRLYALSCTLCTYML
jgi:hypothetical protein